MTAWLPVIPRSWHELPIIQMNPNVEVQEAFVIFSPVMKNYKNKTKKTKMKNYIPPQIIKEVSVYCSTVWVHYNNVRCQFSLKNKPTIFHPSSMFLFLDLTIALHDWTSKIILIILVQGVAPQVKHHLRRTILAYIKPLMTLRVSLLLLHHTEPRSETNSLKLCLEQSESWAFGWLGLPVHMLSSKW